MRKIIPFSVLTAIAAFIIFSIQVTALDETPAGVKKLKLRAVSPPKGYNELDSIEELVFTGGKSGLAFAIASPGSDPISSLLSNRGKLTSPDDFTFFNEPIAIWLGSTGGASGTPAAPAKGFLIYWYDWRETANVSVAEFDAGGNLVGEARELLDMTTSKAVYWRPISLAAAAGPNSIAVAVGARYYVDYNYKEGPAIVYFFEIDFNGELIGKANKVSLKGGGKGLSCRVFSPAWNGARWLAPALLQDDKDFRYTVSLIVAGSVASSSPAAKKAKVRTILECEDDDQFERRSECLQFLPDTSVSVKEGAVPAAKAKTLKLLIQRNQWVPYYQHTMKLFDNKTIIQPISGSGGKKGKALEVQLDQWKHKLKLDEKKYLGSQQEQFSQCAPLGDGRMLVALVRCLYRSWEVSAPETKYDYDHQVNLIAFDPTTGEVELLATKSPNLRGWWVGIPILRKQGGKSWLLINHYDRTKPLNACYYTIY